MLKSNSKLSYIVLFSFIGVCSIFSTILYHSLKNPSSTAAPLVELFSDQSYIKQQDYVCRGSGREEHYPELFYNRIQQQLPLQQAEREIYGVLTNRLHPYHTISKCREDGASSSRFITLKTTISNNTEDIRNYFLTQELKDKITQQRMNDFRMDKDLYQYNDETHQITTKLPSVNVHALFNHNTKYRDEHLNYPFTTNKTRDRYCDHVCAATNGVDGMCVMCDYQLAEKTASRYFYKVWCEKPNIDLAILSIQDGILDYGTGHEEVRFNVYDRVGNLFLMTIHGLSYKNDKANVEYHPLLASTGTVHYPTAFGHFPIEILPRILFLHHFIPLHIPIIVSDSKFVRSILNELTQYGIISEERKFIYAQPNTYYVASRLYFIHSKSATSTPLTPDLVLRIGANMINNVLERNVLANPINKTNYILIVDRSDVGSRAIENNEEMIKKVKEIAEGKHSIQVVNLKLTTIKSFLEIGMVFHDAIGIIAPHGAGLANMNASTAKKLKFLVEIGWKVSPQQFTWPADYYCQARGLGFKYYAVTAIGGNYYTKMKVDVSEIEEIVNRELNGTV